MTLSAESGRIGIDSSNANTEEQQVIQSTSASIDTKRRPGRLRSQVILILFVASIVLLPLACVGLEVAMVYYAKPVKRTTHMDAWSGARLKEAGLTADENLRLWRQLGQAVEQAGEITIEVQKSLLEEGAKPRSEWLEEPQVEYTWVTAGAPEIGPETRALKLMHDRGVFDMLDKISRVPMGPLTDSESTSVVFNMKGYIDLSKAIAADMHLATREEDHLRAIARLEDGLMLGLGRMNLSEPLGILMGHAIHGLVLSEVREQLLEQEFDEATCLAMGEAIDRFCQPLPDDMRIGATWALFLDRIENSFTGIGRGGGSLIPWHEEWDEWGLETPSWTGATRSRFLGPRREEVIAVFDEWVDLCRAQLAMLPVEATTPMPEPEEFLAQKPENIRDLVPLESMLSSLRTIAQYGAASDIMSAATRIMVGLELFHARHGRFPTALDELVPSVFPGGVPHDPLHNGAFGYRLVVDDPLGREYLLYSTGYDQQDNGGRSYDVNGANPRQMDVIRKPELTGYDQVINWPRPPFEEY